MKKLFKKLSKADWIFIAILALGAVLRFYRLSDMANYDADQQYAANFAYSVVHNHLKLLIGEPLSIEGLFMGPWYFYFLTPFFALFHLHPLGGFVGSVTLGLMGIGVYYGVAKSLLGEKAALIAAFLKAILYASIQQDWSMSPAYVTDTVALLTWYGFYKYWHGDTKIFPLLGLLFGLYTSFHPVLFPFYIVFIVLVLIRKKLPSLKTAFKTLIAFLIPVAPLLLFEYWHSFLEIKRVFQIFSGVHSATAEPRSWSRVLEYLGIVKDLPFKNLNFPILPEGIFLIILGIFLLWAILKKVGFWKDSFHVVMLSVTFIVFIVYYIFFPTHVPDYYFSALSILGILYIGGLLSLLTKNTVSRIVLGLLLIAITVSNMQILQGLWNNPSLITLSHKDDIVKQILARQPKDQDFYVSYIENPGWNFGFDYLFKLYGHVPQTRAATPPIYTIVLPKALSEGSINYSSGNIGLILPK